jgi:hypothetical protein
MIQIQICVNEYNLCKSIKSVLSVCKKINMINYIFENMLFRYDIRTNFENGYKRSKKRCPSFSQKSRRNGNLEYGVFFAACKYDTFLILIIK